MYATYALTCLLYVVTWTRPAGPFAVACRATSACSRPATCLFLNSNLMDSTAVCFMNLSCGSCCVEFQIRERRYKVKLPVSILTRTEHKRRQARANKFKSFYTWYARYLHAAEVATYRRHSHAATVTYKRRSLQTSTALLPPRTRSATATYSRRSLQTALLPSLNSFSLQLYTSSLNF